MDRFKILKNKEFDKGIFKPDLEVSAELPSSTVVSTVFLHSSNFLCPVCGCSGEGYVNVNFINDYGLNIGNDDRVYCINCYVSWLSKIQKVSTEKLLNTIK